MKRSADRWDQLPQPRLEGQGYGLSPVRRQLVVELPAPGELRFFAECPTEALEDALRIAEARGRRLNDLNQQPEPHLNTKDPGTIRGL